jgi:succinoglycan biosynthesis protein ExoA
MVKTLPKRVIVLIPTLNEARHIDAVLTQLLSQDTFGQQTRVIVADGGSNDGTQTIVEKASTRFPNVELRHNPGRTQACAMNMLLASEFASYDIAVRCDAHAAYPPDFISRLITELDRQPDVSSIVIPMDAVPDGNCFRRGLALVADSKLGAGGSPHRGGVKSGFVDHGHHAAFRLDAFRTLGGYDTRFIANEDAEFDRRLIGSRHKIWLDANIRIGYFPRDTLGGLWRQYYRYGIGRAQNCLKHGDIPALRQMIPVVHVLLLILSILLLPFSIAGLIWPVFYVLLLGVVAIQTAAKHKTLCGLIALPALAAMHTAWGSGFLIGLFRNLTRQNTLSASAKSHTES